MKYKKTLFWEEKENTIEESKKYSSRTEFYKKSHGAYAVAKNNGWLDEMTWLNKRNVYKDKIDTVYLYNFKDLNAVYVGRTIYPETRDRQHRTRECDSVFKFAKENSVEIPPMEIVENGLTILEGVNKEKYWEKHYRELGFNMINKQPCGSLGLMCKGKWSKKKCFEEGKKYKTRSEFQKNASHAFHKSKEKGWLDEMTWFPTNRTHPNGYWRNKENFMEEAKKYKSKKELERNNLSAYMAGYRYGYFEDCTWFDNKPKLPYGYWKNKDNVIEEAKKYKSKIEFQKGNQSAYGAAIKYGWLDEMTWLNKNKVTTRGSLKNKEYIMSEARKYASKAELMRDNKSVYEAALRYNFINEMDWFDTQKPKRYWDVKENVINESKKYSSRSEFKIKGKGAYYAAHKHKWIDEMTWLNKNKIVDET